MMDNVAPGSFRSFLAEDFLDLPESIWREAREEAKDLRKKTSFEAFATDIDPAMVDMARANAASAGVAEHIRFFPKNALGIETQGRRGTVVCNPPYGERLETLDKARELYSAMGGHWKNLDRWQIYVICADDQFQKYFNRRADNVRKLYNGMLKCFYYQFYKTPEQKNFPPRRRGESHPFKKK